MILSFCAWFQRDCFASLAMTNNTHNLSLRAKRSNLKTLTSFLKLASFSDFQKCFLTFASGSGSLLSHGDYIIFHEKLQCNSANRVPALQFSIPRCEVEQCDPLFSVLPARLSGALLSLVADSTGYFALQDLPRYYIIVRGS